MNTPDDPLLNRVLERRYRIDVPIARGGMSSVYVGTDLRLHRRVAIKVMDSRYANDPLFLRRFQFEARAVAGLSHPGLVAVYDQSVDGDTAFLVMELVRGGSIRELLRERGPMPPHAVASVAIGMLGGLGTAHRAGLVHRDVKPENVLVSDTGDIKVADFGLVRAVAEAGVTSASVILGTAAYLSPEQVTSTEVDARSDVYSAGVLMFELLTGRQPFSGSTPLALAYQRLTFDVPAPGDLIDGIPSQFDDIVLRATERDPAARYVDGFDMQHA
ncbi:MAG: protein kinase, partial [Gordonia sp. (in: high G+C Gram-positive bacteria)]